MAEGATYKRLIVACDGTWQAGDKVATKSSWWSYLNPFYATPSTEELAKPILGSNVMKICTALSDSSIDLQGKEVQQIVYYQNGLGTDGGNTLGGYTGAGLDANVIEAYFYLSMNYSEGDEIFLFGFSRGAYTARCIADLIRVVGIFQKRSLGMFPAVWNAYKTKKTIDDFEAWARQTESQWERIRDVRIQVVGVWDTVGNLGGQYKFYNVELGHHVDNAFQALSLDEHRKPYAPAIWTLPPMRPDGSLPNLLQVWFAGSHTNVGGGSPDAIVQNDPRPLSDLALVWMIDCCAPFLGFDDRAVSAVRQRIQSFTPTGKESANAYGTGVTKDGFSGWIKVLGSQARTPGLAQLTGTTNEYMHPSVRIRKVLLDKAWKSEGLNGYSYRKKYDAQGWRSGWVWDKTVQGGPKNISVDEWRPSSEQPGFERSLMDKAVLDMLEGK